jgi:hypothetical protein
VGRAISQEFGREAARIKITNIGSHGYSKLHDKYNAAVREELDRWAKSSKIDLSKATAADAKAFAKHLATSKNTAIRTFNGNLMKEARAAGRLPHTPDAMRKARGRARGAGYAGALGPLAEQLEMEYQNRKAWEKCLAEGC